MRHLNLGLLIAKIKNRNTIHRSLIGMLRYHVHPLRYITLTKMMNIAAVKTQKWLKKSKVWGRPYRYWLDPVNICNLRCPLCPTGLGILGRERGRFDFDDFTRIVDQIAEYAYFLELFNWGEPFLHPRIFDMIRYARDRRIAVRLSSNFNYFDREMAEETVMSGLDRIWISVDGSTQEVYEKYRRGGKLAKVLDNVRLLMEEKERRRSLTPFTSIRMLINRYNEHQIDEVHQIAADLGVDIFSKGYLVVDTTDPIQIEEWLPANELQSFYDYSADKLENAWHCPDLWESMAIHWDGGVAPCCWLHQKTNDFENIFEKSLADIWNGEAYVSSRRMFALGGPKTGPKETICTICRGKPLYLKD